MIFKDNILCYITEKQINELFRYFGILEEINNSDVSFGDITRDNYPDFYLEILRGNYHNNGNEIIFREFEINEKYLVLNNFMKFKIYSSSNNIYPCKDSYISLDRYNIKFSSNFGEKISSFEINYER